MILVRGVPSTLLSRVGMKVLRRDALMDPAMVPPERRVEALHDVRVDAVPLRPHLAVVDVKVARSTFSATFMLQCMVAMDMMVLDLGGYEFPQPTEPIQAD